ncbi:hypothetical protein ACFPK9_08570 [Rubritalea spongiae]|uniref:Right-handed parallel beta-helix repeat-containing protein n=1 Tax=Rubritalea spongiae TaxID=430797 RepID=A0ABW5E1I4_9BACT
MNNLCDYLELMMNRSGINIDCLEETMPFCRYYIFVILVYLSSHVFSAAKESLTVTSVDMEKGELELCLEVEGDAMYILQKSDNLSAFLDVGIPFSAQSTNLYDIDVDSNQSFYRLRPYINEAAVNLEQVEELAITMNAPRIDHFSEYIDSIPQKEAGTLYYHNRSGDSKWRGRPFYPEIVLQWDGEQVVTYSYLQASSVYVDPEGDDTNHGLDTSNPVQTLGKACEIAQSLTLNQSYLPDGEEAERLTIFLKRGGRWKESINLDYWFNQNPPRIAAWEGDEFCAELPVIDGADYLNGDFMQVDGYQNVYKISNPNYTGAARSGRVALWEEGKTMVQIDGDNSVQLSARLQMLEQIEGSYTADDPSLLNESSPWIYVNPNGSDFEDLIEISRRDAIQTSYGVASFVEIDGVHTRCNLGNNGSLDLSGSEAKVSNCIMSNGHKHNGLFAYGEIDNVVAYGKAAPTPFEAFDSSYVFYYPDGTDKELSATNIVHIKHNELESVGSQIFNHDSRGNLYKKVFVGRSITMGNIKLEAEQAQITETYFESIEPNAARPLFTHGGDGSWLICKNGGHGGSGTWSNSVFTLLVDFYNDELCRVSGDLVLLNNIYYSKNALRGHLIRSFTGSPSVRMQNCVLFGQKHLRFIESAENYSGDHNIYYVPGGKEVECRIGATEYSTLASWQSAVNADANSLWLTEEQAENFWLGGIDAPANGDFRINPNAEATGADGTIYKGEFPDGTPFIENGIFNVGSQTPINEWPLRPMNEQDALEYINGTKPFFMKGQNPWAE